MGASRNLPAKRNPLLTGEKPDHADLIRQRKLGSTTLAVKPGQIGTINASKPEHLGRFEYAHLRAPLPDKLASSEIFAPKVKKGEPKSPTQTTPEAYFLMRRSSDGHVSATGMFKACFPWATNKEEEAERSYLKALDKTTKDEIAGNVWIPEEFALELAEEYGIRPWIVALLDPSPIVNEESKKQIAAPPPFVFTAGSDGKGLLTPSTPGTHGRGRGRPRAGSPMKGTPATGKAGSPKKRIPKAVKEASAAAARQVNESLQAAADDATSAATTAATTVTDKAETALEKSGLKGGLQSSPMLNGDKTSAPKKASHKKKDSTATAKKAEPAKETPDKKVTIEVQSGVAVNGAASGEERTTVKVSMPADSPQLPMPESAEEMLKTAKEMVAEAHKLEADGDTKKGKGKRKLEVKDSEDEDDEADGPATKKTKLMEQEVRKQKVRNRALVGVGLSVALSAAIPYFLGG